MEILPYDITLALLLGADIAGWLFAYITQPIPPINRIRPWRAVLFLLFNGALIAGVTFAVPESRFPAFVAVLGVYLLVNPWFLSRIGYTESVMRSRLGRMYFRMCWIMFAVTAAFAMAIMLEFGINWPMVTIGLATMASLTITTPAGIIHQQQELLMGIQHASKRHHSTSH